MLIQGRSKQTKRSVALRSTEDGELWVTNTPTEESVLSLFEFNLSTQETQWAIIASLNGNGWPHNWGEAVRLDVDNIRFAIDKSSNAAGRVSLGVITRVGETNGDVDFFFVEPFDNSAETSIEVLQVFSPAQIKCGVENGRSKNFVTSVRETNVSAINTGATIQSAKGGVPPVVGDIICQAILSGGTEFDADVQVMYHAQV